jgi:chromosome segregation ATPase
MSTKQKSPDEQALADAIAAKTTELVQLERQYQKHSRVIESEISAKTAQLAQLERQVDNVGRKAQQAVEGYQKQTREAEAHFEKARARVEAQYVAKTKDFNGNIAKLQRQRKQEVDAVDTLKAERAALAADVERLSVQRERLQAQVAQLVATVGNLTAATASGKKGKN